MIVHIKPDVNIGPFNFEHFNLTQVKIYLDGQQASSTRSKPQKTMVVV